MTYSISVKVNIFHNRKFDEEFKYVIGFCVEGEGKTF